MKLKKILFNVLIVCIISIYCVPSYAIQFNANSQAAILLNSNTGKILYEKNAYKKMYPASTTKIMTAILALENCNLSDIATVSYNATLLPSGYSGANLQVGEELSIEDLLYLLMLVSANDAAVVIAEHVGGSVYGFSEMMNNKAKEIGCSNTHFVNPNGVHDDNHYSTAYDLALIAKYAMNNNLFRNIVACKSYKVKPTNKYQERTLYNTNKLLHEFNNKDENRENIFYYEYAIGIKTGYTTVAKNCLVACAKKGDTEYIAVILGANTDEDNYNSQRYSDAKNLFETAFNNYSFLCMKNKKDAITTVEVPNAFSLQKNLSLILENDINILVKNEDINIDLVPEIKLYEDKIQAPIKKGSVLGTVTYTYDNKSYTENIIASHTVNTSDEIDFYLKIAVGGFFSILVLKFCMK